ncbi:MAG: SMC-Scp complex subunit ScpB, partial [Angelakisella sp.]
MKLTKRENELLAVLFASGEPVEKARLAEALELDMGEVTDALTSLDSQLTAENSPLELRRLEDSYQLCTAASYAPVIRRALEMKRNIPLSAAAMETLAIISYNQPVT